ncbi:2-dehydro-3-deoxygalactonokinase [Aquincola sp. S2]|uniref:2-dehydro-3-deoxygalactonokinase n=1 Tax=Pseudaquabacterium terrae TaxID=2732868 RepID=A0ABX2ER41_9BURK|nr:2-dehydro-3-deoxygalactonokinase [Aquabacterium terrae]NRF71149.1 2-dehydro-3-deoxygalactonokinase [Aquabacterium terrae]
MRRPAFVGIDWGTTNRRAWLLDDAGEVLALHRDEQGSLACRGRFVGALEDLLARWPAARGVPVVMSGMVGSALGWQEVPYLDAGVPLAELPRHVVPVADAPAGAHWCIVPGLCCRDGAGRVDVMRGEETQLLGADALAAGDGWTVLPGTHSKWVRLHGGVVAELRTYLSGELFATLRAQGTLAPLMAVAADDAGAAFDRGVQALGDEELGHALFGARARVMAAGAPAAGTADYVSGLLIAAEWRDALRRGLPPGQPVRLLGEPALAERHARCARHFGGRTETLDPQAAQLAAWRTFLRSLSEHPS